MFITKRMIELAGQSGNDVLNEESEVFQLKPSTVNAAKALISKDLRKLENRYSKNPGSGLRFDYGGPFHTDISIELGSAVKKTRKESGKTIEYWACKVDIEVGIGFDNKDPRSKGPLSTEMEKELVDSIDNELVDMFSDYKPNSIQDEKYYTSYDKSEVWIEPYWDK